MSIAVSEKERFIVHVDMDAFFASVEERDNPAHKGKPIIVGADPKGGKGRGVVAACSYAARKFGIHSAMPISIAYKKCPEAVFLPGDMAKYATASRKIFKILERFTPDIEPISIDEAFLDITGSWHLFVSPVKTCRLIKEAIKKDIGLTASIGMAPNKMTAKIASDINKPDGLTVVRQKDVLNFLHPLAIGKLWGVGEKTEAVLKSHGINTIGDIADKSEEEMARLLGENGRHVWFLSCGIDPRPVEADDEARSVSNEHTFEEDTTDRSKIMDALMFLSEKVSRRLRKDGLTVKTITLQIRFSDFKTYTRAVTLKTPTNYADVLYENSLAKAESFGLAKHAVRLIGVKVSGLSDKAPEADFFSRDADKKEQIAKALDKIKDKFGEKSIKHRSGRWSQPLVKQKLGERPAV